MNSTTSNLLLGAIPANEVLVFSTSAELRENPRAKYIVQGTQGSEIIPLTGSCYIPSLVGRTKAQYMADDRYQAEMGSSPSELAILNILTALGNDVPSPLGIQVLLEYTVEFFDVKHLAQS